MFAFNSCSALDFRGQQVETSAAVARNEYRQARARGSGRVSAGDCDGVNAPGQLRAQLYVIGIDNEPSAASLWTKEAAVLGTLENSKPRAVAADRAYTPGPRSGEDSWPPIARNEWTRFG